MHLFQRQMCVGQFQQVMIKKLMPYVVLLFGWHFAQSSEADEFLELADSVHLQEVTVSEDIPLDDATMVHLYKTMQTSSIDQINERLGGVSVIGRGAYAKEPGITSFSGGQINVTIDGMKMFGACTDKMDPITSYVETVNLKSINLSYGTNGANFGSTVGGSYNMQLESPILNKFTAEVGGNYETIAKGVATYAKLNIGKKKWAYRVSGVFKDYQTYTDGNGDIVLFTQYKKINVHNSFLYMLSEGHSLKLDAIVDDAFDVGYPALPMDVSKAKGRIYSLTYSPEAALGKINYFTAKLYANTVYHLMDDSQRDSLFLVENNISGQIDSVYMRMDMPGWSQTYGAFVEGTVFWRKKHRLDMKVENYLNWSKAEMTMFMNNLSNPGEPPMFVETWPENYRNVSGVYLKNTYEISPSFTWAIDGRADIGMSKLLSEQGKKQFEILGYDTYQTYTQTVFSVNSNVVGYITPHSNILLGGGYGERLPTLTEQFGFYLFNAQDGYDYIGNPDIKTEKALNLRLNWQYTNTILKLNWRNQVHFFKDYIFGELKPDYGALNLYASGLKQFVNLPTAFTFSSNAQLLWKPVKELEVINVISYMYGEINQREAMPLIPPLKNRLSLAYRKTNYYVQAENELSAAQNRINSNFGEVSIAGFSLFHVRGGYTLKANNAQIQFTAGVENIFDRAYSEHLDWGDYLRPGRNFVFGLRIKY